jgi:hypothetical protein
MTQSRESDPSAVEGERVLLSQICERVGSLVTGKEPGREPGIGESLLQEALSLWPANSAALLALARIRLAEGLTDKAAGHCRTALTHDPDHAPAAVLLSETLLRALNSSGGGDSSVQGSDGTRTAIEPLTALLKRRPTDYTALVCLLPLLQRAGAMQVDIQWIYI